MAALLEVRELKTYFFLRRGVVKAVDDISFSVEKGETLGIVGESGCGKTVAASSIMKIVPKPGKYVGGSILFNGEELLTKSESEMRKFRGRHISQILQDPLSSLNPVFNIRSQVAEGIVIHDHPKAIELRDRVTALLRRLGIPGVETRLNDYPHQFSGGMRQRVVGGIAIACRPELLIADEPTTSLDVTIQMQYLNLLKEIQQRDHLGMIFITHDFGVVAKMCDRVAVMYAGKIVEMGPVRDIFDHPTHPYTIALMHSVPKVDERVERLFSIKGQPPSLLNVQPGCAFMPRCTHVSSRCIPGEFPMQTRLSGDSEHIIRCWNYV